VAGVTELDGKILERVRKLLAKAEHPTTPVEEAQAFSAKASALMARYAIDRAVMEAATPDGSAPVARQLTVEAPYALPRAVLLDRVARAHRVRVVLGPDAPSGGRLCTLVGFPVDLDVAELLFTSLLLQASTAMLHASRATSRPKAFRRAFLLGYAETIGRRLASAHAEANEEAETARPGAALVLADRSEQVDAFLGQQFPRLRNLRMTASSGGGLSAGRQAGARADLSTSERNVAAMSSRQLA
jgi:hypothetical protein